MSISPNMNKSVSPCNFFNNMTANFNRGTNNLQRFAKIFQNNDDVEANTKGPESEISFDKNDGKIVAAEPEKKFKPNKLHLDLDFCGDNGANAPGDIYPSNVIQQRPSPMNLPQSCTSNNPFPSNTPNHMKFLSIDNPNFGHSPHLPSMFQASNKSNNVKLQISPNSGFTKVNMYKDN